MFLLYYTHDFAYPFFLLIEFFVGSEKQVVEKPWKSGSGVAQRWERRVPLGLPSGKLT